MLNILLSADPEFVLRLATDEKGFDPLSHPHTWELFFWTVIIFALVYFLLHKFAFGPLMQTVKAREAKIGGEIAAAEKALKDAETLRARNQTELDAAQANARKLLDEARARAEGLQAQLEATARTEATAMITRACAEIEAEKARASEELKSLIAELGAAVATRVLKREVRSADCVKDTEDLLAAVRKAV
ncbi:MAG: ATP synthase F0 subunit B [Planctomycetes bacterium]|nr:ATP synthase F0 subunit B [Planctomycetota bacterium]